MSLPDALFWGWARAGSLASRLFWGWGYSEAEPPPESTLSFNGVDLSALLASPRVGGEHDLVAMEVQRFEITGRELPDHSDLHRARRTIRLTCVVVAASHVALVAALETLRAAVSPRLGYCYMTFPDLAGKRIRARAQGFPVEIATIPYDMEGVQFDLSFKAYPFFEDVSAQTASVTGLTGTIVNDGDLPAYPVYTLTATGALASGLAFSVGGVSYGYTGALVPGDVLTVDAETGITTKNGTRDITNVDEAADYPPLPVGEASVALSSIELDLSASFRRRYE